MSVCIMHLYSVFVLCVFPPPLSIYSSCILFSSVSMHAPLCDTSSLAIRLEGSIFGGRPICLAEHILSGGLSTRRTLRLEGCFSDFLFFSLFLVSVAGSTFFSLPDGLRHLFRDHNPYSILHIPYSELYVIYDLEVSNDVNLQSTEFDPCR